MARAQSQAATPLKDRIESEIHLIKVATEEHLPNERIGYLWAVLAADYRRAGDFAASEIAYIKALALQRDVPSAVHIMRRPSTTSEASISCTEGWRRRNAITGWERRSAVGFASWKSGRPEDADNAMRSAIETMRGQKEPADRALLHALIEYRDYLKAERRNVDAEVVERELAAAKLQLSAYCAACVDVRSLSDQSK